MKLFDTAYESSTFPKKPSLKAYLASIGKKSRPKRHMVQIIWLPSTYDSYGIETEHFRTSVLKDSMVGMALGELTDGCGDLKTSIYLEVVVTPKGANNFLFTQGKEVGYWIQFPDSKPIGLKFLA